MFTPNSSSLITDDFTLCNTTRVCGLYLWRGGDPLAPPWGSRRETLLRRFIFVPKQAAPLWVPRGLEEQIYCFHQTFCYVTADGSVPSSVPENHDSEPTFTTLSTWQWLLRLECFTMQKYPLWIYKGGGAVCLSSIKINTSAMFCMMKVSCISKSCRHTLDWRHAHVFIRSGCLSSLDWRLRHAEGSWRIYLWDENIHNTNTDTCWLALQYFIHHLQASVASQ